MIEGEGSVDFGAEANQSVTAADPSEATEQGGAELLPARFDVNGLPLKTTIPPELLSYPVGNEVSFSASDNKRPQGWQSSLPNNIFHTEKVNFIAHGTYKYLGFMECDVIVRNIGDTVRRQRTGKFAVFEKIWHGRESFYIFQIPAENQ